MLSWRANHFCACKNEQTADDRDFHGNAQQVFEFLMILRPVLITDAGTNGHRAAEEDGSTKKRDVLNDAIRVDAVQIRSAASAARYTA